MLYFLLSQSYWLAWKHCGKLFVGDVVTACGKGPAGKPGWPFQYLFVTYILTISIYFCHIHFDHFNIFLSHTFWPFQYLFVTYILTISISFCHIHFDHFNIFLSNTYRPFQYFVVRYILTISIFCCQIHIDHFNILLSDTFWPFQYFVLFWYISTTSKFGSLFVIFTSGRTNQPVWPFNILLLLSNFCIFLLSHTIESDHFSSLGSPCILHYYKTSAKANKFYSSFKYCCLWWLVPEKPQSPCTLEPQTYFLDFSNLKKNSGWSLLHKRDAFRLCPIFSTVHLSATPFNIAFLFWLLWF